jgi:putative ABC transport system permease protein
VVILAGAVASTGVRRAHEVALLKTLGVTRRGVAGLFATEYALSGLMAGLVGGLGAFGLAWAFLDQVVEVGPELPWLDLPVAALLTALLAVLSGLAASARALRVRPIESLRG